MAQTSIKYYPVGNGDNTLITLNDGTSLLVDCNIRECSDDKSIYDVKSDLLGKLNKRNNNPYLDVFILTHGDWDHCRGFNKHFYQGDPKNYSDSDRKENRIIIDEMWFSPMIAEEHSNDDEDAYQKEAERRLELHKNKSSDKDLPGNRIKIVGYDPSNKNYSDLNHLRAIPGTIVSDFNCKKQSTFSIFIHAPFKEHLTSAEKDKNSTSIVFQARFKEYSFSSDFSCLAIFGGDSDYYSWQIILEKTRKHQNDIKEKALDWDLFLAPHHCSWTYFNNTPQKDNPKPQNSSLEVLSYKRKGGKVISSSKKIMNNDDNPPHYQAKQEYIKKLGNTSDFLNTAIEPTESEPKPIEFIITSNGPVRNMDTKTGHAITSAGGSGAASTIIKQG